ncbi:hypothetical protein ACQP00_21935 [Dactylosporangium sp. CS-047395]|uniref:hypothetical protein n=1 Tax=Dactylosporangium sp. CS-047395 TaxID=3239936 RepID=UPI003D907C17
MPAPGRQNTNSPAHPDLAAHRRASPAATGQIPITIWRLDDRDETAADDAAEPRFARRLARQLVAVYTERGDTVADFTGDVLLEFPPVWRSFSNVID